MEFKWHNDLETRHPAASSILISRMTRSSVNIPYEIAPAASQKIPADCIKPRSHLAEYLFRLFTIEINSAIANNLKPIGMMKMQCVTIYPNIYECVSDYNYVD